MKALALVAAAILPACDSPSDPDPTVTSVAITGAPTAAVSVGDTATLSAIVTDSEGGTVTDAAAVTWSSTAPDVATVPLPGKVVGVSGGTAKIIASTGGVADTIDVAITTIITGCPAAGLNLPVGAIRQINPRLDIAACPTGVGAQYTLVTFNGSESGELNLTVQGSGLGAATSLSSPRGLALSPSLAARSLGGALRDADFETGLRAQERTIFRRYLPAARAMGSRTRSGVNFSRAAEVPVVGDTLWLNVRTDDDESTPDIFEPCDRPRYTIGRVVAVTEKAIVVSDTANPKDGFTGDDFRHIGMTFDTLVYPIDTQNFGTPTDIDENGGRVVIYYTKAVNQLTERNSSSFVGGFFYGRDLFPREDDLGAGLSGCKGSNLNEMFYMLVPDPTGEVNGNVRTKAFVQQQTIATVAHEFQHLISFSRGLYINNRGNPEAVWLNEGLSHIAEELVFYRASGLGPRQNLNVTPFQQGGPRRTAFIEYMIGNLGRLWDYIEDPHRFSPYSGPPEDGGDGLGTRGAAWAFLRYAADQSGKPEAQIWNGLANGASSGLANLEDVLGAEPIPLVRDWTVANFADDFVSGATGRFSQPSWDFRSPNNVFRIFRTPPSLRVVPLPEGSTTLSIVAGGGAFYTFRTPATGRAEIRINAGGAPVPPAVAAFLIRTQ